jgi:hypothetical protein
VVVRTNEDKAAAAARLRGPAGAAGEVCPAGAGPVVLRPDADVAAGRKDVNALVSDLPSRNGWTVAEHAGDRSPAKVQRLLNRAPWDEAAAMSEIRKYATAGLDAAARRSRRRRMTGGQPVP